MHFLDKPTHLGFQQIVLRTVLVVNPPTPTPVEAGTCHLIIAAELYHELIHIELEKWKPLSLATVKFYFNQYQRKARYELGTVSVENDTNDQPLIMRCHFHHSSSICSKCVSGSANLTSNKMFQVG